MFADTYLMRHMAEGGPRMADGGRRAASTRGPDPLTLITQGHWRAWGRIITHIVQILSGAFPWRS